MPYLPAELIEKILPNLPVKSLRRFSAASKLWNSIISRPEFAQSYRGREMIVFKSLRLNDDVDSDSKYRLTVCPLSSLSSDNPSDKTTPFDFPFDSPPGPFFASCGHLWCFEFEKSLLLYNPSIQTYRKLTDPNMETGRIGEYTDHPVYGYGLEYDSVSDDYKIVKIRKRCRYYGVERESLIYSLRNDCWRKFESQLPEFNGFWSKEGLFVSGALHWLITRDVYIENANGERLYKRYILSFDLAEEKFGLIEVPELLQKKSFGHQFRDMILFGGKLRVYLNCVSQKDGRCYFSVWVLEDYEFKLWTKEMEFDYGHMPKLRYASLKPFYFYDDDGKLVRAVTSLYDVKKMFIYEEGDGSTPTLVEKNFGSDGFGFIDSYTYVESFVSFSNWNGDLARKVEEEVIRLSRVVSCCLRIFALLFLVSCFYMFIIAFTRFASIC